MSILKHFWKAFEKNTLDGRTPDSPNPGCESTMNSTSTSSDSNKIYTKTTNMSNKVYQWIKGDNAGKVVKWDGTIEEVDGLGNFLIFTDGTRGNETLLNDFFVELASEDDLVLYDESKMTTVPAPKQQPPAVPVHAISTPVQALVKSPIHQLLAESKKTKTTVSLGLVADMPPVELMRVLSDSYDDGEKQVLDFIATTLDIEDIKKQIAKQIWLSAFSSKPQKRQRNVKEE